MRILLLILHSNSEPGPQINIKKKKIVENDQFYGFSCFKTQKFKMKAYITIRDRSRWTAFEKCEVALFYARSEAQFDLGDASS